MNRATLRGFVGGDPDIRATQSGAKVASFNLATSKRWKDKQSGEMKDKTEWHRIQIWNEPLIDNVIAKYVKKGTQLLVEGEIQYTEYTDKENVRRFATNIVVQDLELLDRSEGSGQRPPAPQAPPPGVNTNGASSVAGAMNGSLPDEGPPSWHNEIPF